MFNLYGQLKDELQSFYQDKVHIAGTQNNNGAKYLKKNDGGYSFSQWETLNTVELYYNSKFETGLYDSEGQRKVFLNICKFRCDVSSKQVDLDVKDFVFIPDENSAIWPAYFLNKKFKQWAKLNGFGQLINDCVNDYPKYGSVVIKRVGDELKRVPILTLRNPHDAKSLKTADFVIEEHKDMSFEEIQAMKEWDMTQLDILPGDRCTIYERYGWVTVEYYKTYNKQKVEVGDDKKTIDCMAIVTEGKVKDSKPSDGNVLFLEEIKDRPYEEAHWARQDGRWLGIGEVENQFENQIMRNMTANMRRRGLLWSAKKIFQSSDSELSKNLIKDVRDGEVLKIGPNGNVTQVNMNTQNLGEFQSAEDVWENNSNQKSFTFEVATGEALPSGTPFRLGVVLSNSVNSHFNLKRENLGMFFNRVVENQIFKIFKKENRKAHTMLIFGDEEGVEELKKELVMLEVNEQSRNTLLSGILPDIQAIQAKVEQELNSRKAHQMDIPDGFYDDAKVACTLVTTGENVNLEKRLETLTNLYNSLAQQQNLEAANKVLRQILSLTGENYDMLTGVKPQAPGMAPGAPQGPQNAQMGQMMQQMGAGPTGAPNAVPAV